MKNLIIRFGLWIARLGGLPEPGYDKSLMAAAVTGITCWQADLPLDSDDMYRRAYKTACTVAQPGPELRFAIARALYLRNV